MITFTLIALLSLYLLGRIVITEEKVHDRFTCDTLDSRVTNTVGAHGCRL